MRRRTITRLAVTAVVVATSAVAVGSDASATPPVPGTFTRITTPSKDASVSSQAGGTATFHVAGVTSLDVTSVDLVCIAYLSDALQVTSFASGVAVNSGAFSATASYSSPPAACRLKAVPAGVDPTTDYLSDYTGPILRFQRFAVPTVGTVPYAYAAYVEDGDGLALVSDAGNCSENALITDQTPKMSVGALRVSCFMDLPAAAIDATTSTHSAVVVDGRSAYLPSGVHNYLDGDLGLSVAQSRLTVTRTRAANGDTTITESSTLERCSASTYPPTTTSCPKIMSTGVQFRRTLLVFRDGHQLRIRDQFVSLDHHAHTIALQYLSATVGQSMNNDTSVNGYVFPHHAGTFKPAHASEVVTGLGAGSGTLLIRSDLYARSDDDQVDTAADTWSRGPSSLRFSSKLAGLFRLNYTVKVPAGGTGFLGFAVSERAATSDVSKLAALAVSDMTPGLSITSPANGATFKSTTTTVRGALSAGANGLPTSVTVSGHRATIKASSATKATYSVVFTEPAGTHTLTVTAGDAAGVTTTKSVRVRNA